MRQVLLRGESALVTAASHTAVDNLAERLIVSGMEPLRLGHPARVSPAVEARSLGVLANLIWDRALAMPIERPDSTTTALLKQKFNA